MKAFVQKFALAFVAALFSASPAAAAGKPGVFDYYALSLSWSPGFCNTHPGAGGSQCDPGAGFTFVVHGLWPNYRNGKYPQFCIDPAPPLPPDVMTRALKYVPTEELASHEWDKHGTCSGLGAGGYFDALAGARDGIVIPPSFATPAGDQTMRANEIIRAFTDANQSLRPGMMTLDCKKSVLQEARFCMSKDLRNFIACPGHARGTCGVRVKIPAPL
jgi:ribonuclease T2